MLVFLSEFLRRSSPWIYPLFITIKPESFEDILLIGHPSQKRELLRRIVQSVYRLSTECYKCSNKHGTQANPIPDRFNS